jgi:uncharacterized protein (DUF4213/DUF364 family)
MTVLETLLTDLPSGWRVTDVYVGTNWVLSLVVQPNGAQRAGVASTPRQIASNARFQIGHHQLDEKADDFTRLLASSDALSAAVGLATLNAVNQPPESALTTFDAADWLAEQSADRTIALFGRFPFIEGEIRPFARQVWVFEQEPEAGEFNLSDITTILPQTDVVAITGSSIINHTIDLILPRIRLETLVVVLGPSTPLSEKLFSCGIQAMFGVRVVNLQQVIASVTAGDCFQKMQGLQRVSLLKGKS